MTLLVWLVMVWTNAAFGEEMSCRGDSMLRLAEVVGEGHWAWRMPLALSTILFGFGHLHQGVAGVMGGVIVGLLLGILYLVSGRTFGYPFSHTVRGISSDWCFCTWRDSGERLETLAARLHTAFRIVWRPDGSHTGLRCHAFAGESV
ncbi:MAG: CPBP family intramembrane metalloprotease [Bacteroidetes bacterium]|nr:CPBP family intramembrane metalloprotease [Bacteroidota bacterium]